MSTQDRFPLSIDTTRRTATPMGEVSLADIGIEERADLQWDEANELIDGDGAAAPETAQALS